MSPMNRKKNRIPKNGKEAEPGMPVRDGIDDGARFGRRRRLACRQAEAVRSAADEQQQDQDEEESEEAEPSAHVWNSFRMPSRGNR